MNANPFEPPSLRKLSDPQDASLAYREPLPGDSLGLGPGYWMSIAVLSAACIVFANYSDWSWFAVVTTFFAAYHGMLMQARMKQRANVGHPVRIPSQWMLLIGSLILGAFATVASILTFWVIGNGVGAVYDHAARRSFSFDNLFDVIVVAGGSILFSLSAGGFLIHFFLPRRCDG